MVAIPPQQPVLLPQQIPGLLGPQQLLAPQPVLAPQPLLPGPAAAIGPPPIDPFFLASVDANINNNLFALDGMLAGVGIGIPVGPKLLPGSIGSGALPQASLAFPQQAGLGGFQQAGLPQASLMSPAVLMPAMVMPQAVPPSVLMPSMVMPQAVPPSVLMPGQALQASLSVAQPASSAFLLQQQQSPQSLPPPALQQAPIQSDASSTMMSELLNVLMVLIQTLASNLQR